MYKLFTPLIKSLCGSPGQHFLLCVIVLGVEERRTTATGTTGEGGSGGRQAGRQGCVKRPRIGAARTGCEVPNAVVFCVMYMASLGKPSQQRRRVESNGEVFQSNDVNTK